MHKLPWPVILASASPRRQELLKSLISEFKIEASNVDEDALGDPDPWVTAQKLAKEKAVSVYGKNPDSFVIGGDTVVAFEGEKGWEQLAKPVDQADAVRMLTLLAGRTHTVITGVCLVWPGGLSSFTEASQVTFKKVTKEQIEKYVEGGEPMDKAGAYGLQGEAKGFVESVRGSVNNVIGLPTERLEEALRSILKG